MQYKFSFLLYCAVALAPPIVLAQHPAARPDPADPAAPVPPVKYESSFADHIPYHEQQLAPWREVNDEVARVGGHIGIVGGVAQGGHDAGKPAAKRPAADATSSSKATPHATSGADHK